MKTWPITKSEENIVLWMDKTLQLAICFSRPLNDPLARTAEVLSEVEQIRASVRGNKTTDGLPPQDWILLFEATCNRAKEIMGERK